MKINFNENLERLYQHIKNKLASEYNVDFTFQVNHFRKGKVESDGNIKIVEQLQKLCKVIPIGKKGTEIPTVEIEPEKKANESKPSDNDSSASTKTEGSKDTNQAQKSTGSGDEEPTPIYVSKENKVAENAVLANRLLALGGEKLASVYKSLCSISLKNHSVLAYVGAWSLCEVLSVKFGKGDNQKFPAYFAQEIGKFASNRTEKNEIKMAFEDIAKKGNLHKHSGKFWNRDARDLIGMFEIITPFLIHVIDNYLEKDVRRQV